jgi:hypothetical protein
MSTQRFIRVMRKMSKPRFDAEKLHSDEELDVSEIVLKVLDKAIRFLEDCKREGLTLGEAIRLFRKERNKFLKEL